MMSATYKNGGATGSVTHTHVGAATTPAPTQYVSERLRAMLFCKRLRESMATNGERFITPASAESNDSSNDSLKTINKLISCATRCYLSLSLAFSGSL